MVIYQMALEGLKCSTQVYALLLFFAIKITFRNFNDGHLG